MLIPRRLTKKERLAAIMSTIDTASIKELPEAEDTTNTGAGIGCERVTITDDDDPGEGGANR